MKSAISYEWFEILEPKTKKHVFVNSSSGKCQWNPPDKFQKLTDNQWWELYDFKSNHFYYYNNQSKHKTWIKPTTNNFVSLVNLQIVKERKSKTFLDQTTQTSQEDLSVTPISSHSPSDHNTLSTLHHAEDNDLGTGKVTNHSDTSLDNIETSGYSTYRSGHIHEDTTYHLAISPVMLDYSEQCSTLPAIRKPIPRTNPNCPRHSSTLRLSTPMIELYSEQNPDDLNTFNQLAPVSDSVKNSSLSSLNQHIYNSCTSINDSIQSELASPLSRTSTSTETYDVTSFFPRNSVINAIERGQSTSTEIWSRTLFTKSGSQLAGIMSWTKKAISDSLLAATPKAYKKKACENFKQIQMYMGDRESRYSKEILALVICRRGISSTAWANEIFMQLSKQVTYNPNNERTFNGWELICICLMFFHPESMEMKSCFKSFLEQYSCPNQTLDPTMLAGQDYHSKSIFCARISLKLLDMSRKANDVTAVDVYEAKKSYASSTIFYSSLNEVMDIQSRFYPDWKLPWIQVALTKEILRCDGARTQGILRIPSELCKIDALCEAIEKCFKRESLVTPDTLPSGDGCDPLLNKILSDLQYEHDPLLLSSVLKYWLRHFRDPLISFDDKDESMNSIARDYTKVLEKINTLPEINYMVLKYLIYFLQVLARPENVVHTNMPVENLVTLMAPTLFKLDFNQLQSAMSLLQSLILNLDTSDMANIS